MLIHREIAEKGRRVYMDFRENPPRLALKELSDEAYTYLSNSDALQNTPIQRLIAMNPQAYQLYLDHGIDLKTEALEIAVCAQHNNGGADVDLHYETTVKNLFAAGECACTLGINRPGGTALNSTQVAALQIADYIAAQAPASPHNTPSGHILDSVTGFIKSTVGSGRPFMADSQKIMSQHFAFLRDIDAMETAYDRLTSLWNLFPCTWSTPGQLPLLFVFRDMIITQLVYARAMIHTAELAGSRGSALVTKSKTLQPENTTYRNYKLLVSFTNGNVRLSQRPVRPLPFQRDLWFENVWKDYNKRRNIS